MTQITVADLNNAKLDVDTIAGIANSTANTVTDRLGASRRTIYSLQNEYPNASNSASEASTSATNANNSANSASTSATNAATSETNALTYKTAAESARDAAIIGAGVYVDEPTGRAAVADGVAFKVQGSGDVAAYEYRRVDVNSSTLIATYPSKSAVDSILNTAIDFSTKLSSGGTYYYATASTLIYNGYITNLGVFTASGAGYKTSDFLAIDATKPLIYSINASTTTSGISFWDESKTFISSINTNNNVDENTVLPPTNCKYIRVTNYSLTHLTPYVYINIVGVENQVIDAKKYTINAVFGGELLSITAPDFVFDGYVNSSGVWVASTAGYKTTDYIELVPLKTLAYSLNASSSVAGISFWDEDKVFISYVTTNNVTDTFTIEPPVGTKYIRASNNSSVWATPSVVMTAEPIVEDATLLKKADLTLQASINLASPDYVVSDKYVNSSGTISNGVGWKHIKIPVVAGSSYTFGRFSINTAGYYAFHDIDNVLISGQFGSVSNAGLPKTLTAPTGAAYLLFDFARPVNVASDSEQLTVNIGTTLIDYVSPLPTVLKINGYSIEGTGETTPTPLPDGIILQGENATLADVIADSVTTGALIANLPTSATGLEVGQAYIDGAFIKVVLA